MKLPLIIGHRGAAHDAPENTLASVRLALDQQADGVEVDVQMTADRQLVVIHDHNLSRLAGMDMSVLQSGYHDLLNIDVGSWKGKQWTGEKIPLISKVIELIPRDRELFIEIKGDEEVWPALQPVLSQFRDRLDGLRFISFQKKILDRIRKNYPHIPLYYLADLSADVPETDILIETALQAKFNGLDLSVHPGIAEREVDRIHAAGLGLMIWTVNDPEEALRLARCGVDGITTDRPGMIRAALQSLTADR